MHILGALGALGLGGLHVPVAGALVLAGVRARRHAALALAAAHHAQAHAPPGLLQRAPAPALAVAHAVRDRAAGVCTAHQRAHTHTRRTRGRAYDVVVIFTKGRKHIDIHT